MKSLIIVLACLNCSALWAQSKTSETLMASIPAGVYLPMFSTDTQPEKVNAFLIDVFPVTNADFLKFVQLNPKWRKSMVKPIFSDAKYLKHWSSDSTFDDSLKQSPVVNLSWFAAKKYCECFGKQLPTTAEWELVAKASEKKADASKDSSFNQRILNWLSQPSQRTTPHVGTTFKNFFGVYDMHGLVWEWTYDFNSVLTTGDSREDSSIDNNLFCGGGSFSSKDINNYAAFMRFALRSSLKANLSVTNLGFRCVKHLTIKPSKL